VDCRDKVVAVNLSDFDHVIDLPRRSHVVYVLFYIRNDEEVERPFYVGETDRLGARMIEYVVAAFGATADFRVGEAIRYLIAKGARVKVGYNECASRKVAKDMERDYIKSFHDAGLGLVNKLRGYNYRVASNADERTKVHEFCDRKILRR
jgi:hypothetical protein